MSRNRRIKNPALRSDKELELNEEWNNFMKKIGEVSGLVKDMASGDKERADAAQTVADQYLNGKIILDEDIQMTVKEDRTVINQKAFQTLQNNETGEVNKDAWMAEVGKDADRRAMDRKIRKEKAETLKSQAMKAFRREEYDRALSYYNSAIEQVKDNAMLYCDRALTNIKLGNYEKVVNDCEWALRINENSFKAHLYKAKAYKELEEDDKLDECKKALEDKFPQHGELIKDFLDKKDYLHEEEN